MQKVNLAEKLALFDTHWDPKVVANYNDNDVMVVKFVGEYPFHKHDTTDDFFLVLEGEVTMEYENRRTRDFWPGRACRGPQRHRTPPKSCFGG